MQAAENHAYKKADIVVSLLPTATSHMVAHGMAPEKFVYIPNGVHFSEGIIDDPLPEPHYSTLMNLKNEGKFILGYAGSHGKANALYSLIDAAAMIKQEQVNFVLVGQGPEKESLTKYAKQKEVAN